MKKSLFISLAVCLLCMVQSPTWGQNLTLTELRQELHTRGARWQAGETSMTRLSPEEQKRRLGLIRFPSFTGPDPQSLPRVSLSTVAVPPTLDWRNNGGNYVTSVKNQGSCGSCWAFATTAGLESVMLRYRQTPNVDLDLSEQVLVSCGGGGSCAGGDPDMASTFFLQSGLPSESCYPYTTSDGSCSTACPGWQASTQPLSNWLSFGRITSVDTMKSLLYTYGPLPTLMGVFQDFFAYAGGIYHHVSGDGVGGHAVLIVGYDDVNQCFIVKNSWGTGWGEQGFFRIAYSELTGPTMFGCGTIGYEMLDHSCPLTVTVNQGNLSSSGGQGSVSVTTPSDCPWAAESQHPNLHITAGGMGKGNGTVSFSLNNQNTTGYTLPIYLRVRDQVAAIWQNPQGACTYSLNPTQTSFGSAGGSGSIGVTTGQNCGWMAAFASAPPWITITIGGGGMGNGTLQYAVAANTTTSPRTGALSIAGQTFTVTQGGTGSCTYSITPTSNSLSSSGGSGTVNVTAASGCTWSATSGASWISVTSGADGSGNGTVGYSVAANTGTTSRSGTMTIAGQTFTVTQAGGGTCTYTISPTANSLGAAGGSGSVAVTTGSNCTWTAASNTTSFLTVTSGASGSGNGTVNYSVAANTTTAQRNGTMTIAGQTFTATQSAVSCTYSISPTTYSFGAGAGTGSVTVTAPSGCTWTAASNTTSFLTVTSGASGSGNGTVNYSVSANTTTSQRNGTMTIAGQTFTATQSAVSCTYSISPTTYSFGAGAGTGSVTVTAPSGCTWTAASNTTSFLTVTSGASGSGNGTVNYSVSANTTTSQRNGTMTIAGQTFTATQSAVSCTYSISPTSQNLSSDALRYSVNVTAPSGCAWTAASNNTDWLSITSGASGSGNGTVTYSVTANSATASRAGTITIAGQTFTATQAGVSTCGVQLSAGGFNFGYLSRQGSFQVSAASTCSWNASTSAPWITFNSGATGKGNGTVIFTIDTNTGAARTGTISVNGTSLPVNQAGSTTCTYVINPTSQSLGAASGTGTVTVTSASGCAWSAASNASWILMNGATSGSGNGTTGYLVTANGGAPRTGTMTIANQTFTITQAGAATCSYAISPTSQNFSTAASGTGTVTVTSASGCAWSAASNASWILMNGATSGSGNGTTGYLVTANGGAPRTGTMTIANQTFTITQAGAATCSYVINPTSQSLGAASGTGTVTVTSASGCAWSAASNASWILMNGATSGSGNGTTGYLVTANGGAPRTGTMTIANQTFTITQAGAATCSYAISPTSQNFSTAASGTGTVTVTAGSGCAWSAASNASWISVTGSGTGNGSVTYTVQANSGASHTGTLTIAGQTFTMTQAGTAPTCGVRLTTGGFNFPYSYAPRQVSIQVTADSTCSWTASSNVPWMSFSSAAPGKGNGSVTLTVDVNMGAARTGTVSINGTTVTVNEGGAPGK